MIFIRTANWFLLQILVDMKNHSNLKTCKNANLKIESIQQPGLPDLMFFDVANK